jgi:hypothetical protein
MARRSLLADYAGTRLADFTTLSYSTYRQSLDGGNNLAIALQFNVDYDLNDARRGYMGGSSFEPYQTYGGHCRTKHVANVERPVRQMVGIERHGDECRCFGPESVRADNSVHPASAPRRIPEYRRSRDARRGGSRRRVKLGLVSGATSTTSRSVSPA